MDRHWLGMVRKYINVRERGQVMKELEQFLNVEAEWVLERLSTGTESNDRNYYQGRLDQLAQVRRYLNQPQIMREGTI
jgi:hypothetical protein